MADIILSSYRKRTIPPCKGCTERTVECHSTCKAYTEWVKAHNTERELVNKKRNTEGMITEYSVDKVEKRKRGIQKWSRKRRTK